MPKLNDTQTILLSSASQCERGSLFPVPPTCSPGTRVSKAIAGLLAAGLVEERETGDIAEEHRTDGQISYGVYVTPAGLAAIGVEPGSTDTHGTQPVLEESPAPAAGYSTLRPSKQASVLALLGRKEGATLPELIEATGWLPHTTRAALTGLRKKGHGIVRGKRGDATCYTVALADAGLPA